MLGNVVGVTLLLAITLGLAAGVRAAWRTRKAYVRWPFALVGGLFTVLGLLATVASIRGMFYAYPRIGRPVQAMDVDRQAERIARGRHLANASCAGCHTVTEQLPLSGGRNLADDIHIPMGNLSPYNLTPSGPLKDWSDGEVFRAIREGVDKDGTRLLVMSAQNLRYLSDDDIKAVIAYLRSQPAVPREVAREHVNVLGLTLAGAGMIPRINEAPPLTVTAPPRGATAEHGEYLVKWIGCRECHGPNLAGSVGGILPPGPSLRVTQGWTTDQFVQTLRMGVDPFGKKLDAAMMPWKFIGRLDDDELQAIHAYLKKVEIPLKK